MIGTKLKNFVCLLVTFWLAVGGDQARAQNVWELKDGRQGVTLGRASDKNLFLLIDDEEANVPIDELSHHVGNIDIMERVEDGTLMAICVGNNPIVEFHIRKGSIRFPINKPEEMDKSSSELSSQNRYFVSSTRGTDITIEEQVFDLDKKKFPACDPRVGNSYLTPENASLSLYQEFLFAHRARGRNSYGAFTACCTFEKVETK